MLAPPRTPLRDTSIDLEQIALTSVFIGRRGESGATKVAPVSVPWR